MNHVSKSVLVTLMLTIAITFSFGQHPIELKIDPKTGDLEEPVTPRVGWLGGVEWFIGDARIKSFKIVESPGNSYYPFTERLPPDQRQNVQMKVGPHWKGCEWNYKIEWTGTTPETHSYDPIISIKPLLGVYDLILLLALIVTCITSVIFLRKWRGAVAELNEVRAKQR